MALQLYVGNKNYSSWSMRPWVLMKQAGIAFEEKMIRFDSFDVNSVFKKELRAVSPVAKVPVLVDDGFAIWDTLAIAEYLAERFPRSSSGRRTCAPGRGRAASAPRCTAVLARCATTAP